jgi:hypothetical protein
MNNKYHIAFDTLTTPDVKRWDHDTRKIVRKAITPIVQEDIQERMENPMAALHGIVEKLLAEPHACANKNLGKLRYAYNGLASALDAQLGYKRSYPNI